MIEEFRSFELLFSEQKKILNEYKYTLERLEQETSRLADHLILIEDGKIIGNGPINEMLTRFDLPLSQIH